MYQEKELKGKEGLQTNQQQRTVSTPPIQLASVIGNQAMLQLMGLKKEEKKPNTTGIPDQMKQNFEKRSGLSFDDVKVHYNSDKPAQLQALAYTQGNQVYVGPGQEKHLGHELGHVVQQKQGRVRATTNVNGVAVNDDEGLEREADGASSFIKSDIIQKKPNVEVTQLFKIEKKEDSTKTKLMNKKSQIATLKNQIDTDSSLLKDLSDELKEKQINTADLSTYFELPKLDEKLLEHIKLLNDIEIINNKEDIIKQLLERLKKDDLFKDILTDVDSINFEEFFLSKQITYLENANNLDDLQNSIIYGQVESNFASSKKNLLEKMKFINTNHDTSKYDNIKKKEVFKQMKEMDLLKHLGNGTEITDLLVKQLNDITTQLSSYILWDSDEMENEKESRIKKLSPLDFDNLIIELKKYIRKNGFESIYMKELNFIIYKYNRELSALPQAKTMDNAPSMLHLAGNYVGVQKTYLDFMQEQSEKFDFGLSFSIPSTSKWLSEKDENYKCFLHENSSNQEYPEDFIEILRSGVIGTKLVKTIFDYGIDSGRKKRNWDFYLNEAGWMGETGYKARYYAESIGGKENHIYLKCPIEGGNMLTGSNFIIVGADSLFATMAEYNINNSVAIDMIAADFNITPDKVYIIEQPGEYHLDMAMTLINDKTVLIKKSQSEVKDEYKTISSKEDALAHAIKDLTKHGFNCIYENGFGIGENYNFLNGEFVKSKKLGGVIFITNGSPNTKAEINFKTFFIKNFPKIKDVIFTPATTMSTVTKEKGGIGCRTKGIPDNLISKLDRMREDAIVEPKPATDVKVEQKESLLPQ